MNLKKVPYLGLNERAFWFKNMINEEIIAVYDKNNRFIKTARRSIVHKKGLYHRSVNILLFNSKNKIFLQKRAKTKTVCPLLWDLSTAEHIKPNEDYSQAAERGLQEELGIKANVNELRDIHLQQNEYHAGKIKDFEFVKLYGAFSEKTTIFLDKKEVLSGKFYSIDKIDFNIKKNSRNYTPWFLDEWQYLKRANKLSNFTLSQAKC